jgi:predicted DNA-binding protein
MATNKRRLQVTLTPEMWEVIDRFHAVTGQSRSSLLVEFMEPVLGQMDDIVQLLEQMAAKRDGALRETQAVVQDAVSRLTEAAREAIEELDAAVAAAEAKPSSSNTGATLSEVAEIIETGRKG